MREGFNFVGPNITPAEEANAAHSMARIRRRENVFHEMELEKTPGELAAIDLLNELLGREFLDLDIAEIPEIRPERFHIMSEEWFSKNEDPHMLGSYTSFEDKAVISRDRHNSPVLVYATIFHEGVHASAHQKHWVDVERKKIQKYRIGYDITNGLLMDTAHGHFQAFSEGVTELTVQEIFQDNGSIIQERLALSQDEIDKIKFAYPLFRAVVRSVCHSLASFRKIKAEEAWKKIKKGQFTGEMMHLRDIEYAYGRGALRILDALWVESEERIEGQKEDEIINERNQKILEFFENYNRPGDNRAQIRGDLAKEILGEAEFQKYCR